MSTGLGRYELVSKLASGGMGSVSLGRICGAGGFVRTVAIKRLHDHLATKPGFVEMFLDEARIAARIRHLNVVPTLDVISDENESYIVMDYVPGASLAQAIEASQGKGLELDIVAAIVTSVCAGLHAAHEACDPSGMPLEIVHRDVSPDNILIGEDGIVRVIDFGVAKARQRLATTEPGSIKGKLAYMAPELLRSGMASRKSDVFGLAAVFWELLAGKQLFGGSDEAVVMTRILTMPVLPPSFVRTGGEVCADSGALAALDTIVLDALERDAEHRTATLTSIGEAVTRVVTPATAARVAGWLRGLLGERLAMRAALVREAETKPTKSASDRQIPLLDDDRPANPVPIESATLPVDAKLQTRLQKHAFLVAAVVGVSAALYVVVRTMGTAPETRRTAPSAVALASPESGELNRQAVASSAPAASSVEAPPVTALHAPAAPANSATPPLGLARGPAPIRRAPVSSARPKPCPVVVTVNADGSKTFSEACP